MPDFTSVGNLAFPPNGSTDSVIPTPPHDLAHTFKFKSYAPKIFHRLREFFDISAAAYMDSVCGDYNFIEFISNSKSGQFFFYSHDGQYMLKTQTKEENKFMIRILPHYYQYLTENPNSLLVRILGMHRIKMYHLRRKVHFVVMTSVFDTPAQINTIYDLKGSLIGRSATQRERESGGVLKDNDLIADNCKLHLGAKKAAFMAQLEKDAMFLAKLNIMDYSLLVGIHHRSQRARDTLGPLNRESSSSVTGGNAAVVAAAAAAGSLAPQVGGVASPDPATVGQAHTHPAGHLAGGISHSNTPFRRASINADGTYVNEASAPNGTPASTYRKKRSSTLESTDLRRDRSNSHAHSHTHSHSHSHHTSAVDVENISVSMSRSVSGDEDDHHTAGRNLFPSVNLSVVGGGAGGTGISAGPSHSSTLIPESESEAEVEEETEGEEGDDEEEQDGEGEEFDESESEYEDVDAGDSDDEHSSEALLPTDPSVDGELVVEDGAGALGMEGYKLSELLHADAVKSNKTAKTAVISGRTSTESTTNSPVYTYGPGQARRHPWTSRRDEGINSRMADGKRGDEIYYLGVIDILQQYNANKRMETLIKVSLLVTICISFFFSPFYLTILLTASFSQGVTNDSKQISSVSPYKYAKRFVSFMDSNID